MRPKSVLQTLIKAKSAAHFASQCYSNGWDYRFLYIQESRSTKNKMNF